MDIFVFLFDFVVHLDAHLAALIQHFGVWSYLIVFLVIFCETGLVVTPILPGDSLLFGLGCLAAIGAMQIEVLVISLSIASIAGDTTNYTIGHFLGPKIFGRFLNQEHLEKTHRFYEKHGGKTIILAKYVPIVRTYAPFVAGIGSMTYKKFALFNIVAGISWISLMTLSGYFFGDIPIVKNNFAIVVMAIIFISILPGVVQFISQKRQRSK